MILAGESVTISEYLPEIEKVSKLLKTVRTHDGQTVTKPYLFIHMVSSVAHIRGSGWIMNQKTWNEIKEQGYDRDETTYSFTPLFT